ARAPPPPPAALPAPPLPSPPAPSAPPPTPPPAPPPAISPSLKSSTSWKQPSVPDGRSGTRGPVYTVAARAAASRRRSEFDTSILRYPALSPGGRGFGPTSTATCAPAPAADTRLTANAYLVR